VDPLKQRKSEILNALENVDELFLAAIVEGAGLIASSMRRGGKLLIFGNGGSAADAQHMAAEVVSSLDKNPLSPALPAIALTTDSSFLTGYSNDFGFQGVFSRQVAALARSEDVVLGISTSGSSLNVIEGLRQARALGVRTIAMTGEAGLIGQDVDLVLRAPSSSTQVIQAIHLFYEHSLCELLIQDFIESPRSQF
jgi:D-sedoheptulose 7-phosphate isomerase